MIGDVAYRNTCGSFKDPLSQNAVWKGVPDGIEWRTATLTIVDDTSYVEEGYGIHVERDALGRVTKKTETLDDIPAVQNYEYDLAGRLVGVTGDVNESWAYDTNGNRTHRNGSLIATFDAQDRILTQSGTSYSHNARGQRTERNQLGQITRYDYDVFGGLKQVALPGGVTIDYAQDPLGRRIGRKVNGTWTNKWLYKDQLNPIAELDANDRLKKLFVYADKAHVPAYMITYKPDGTEDKQYRIVSDLLGSVRVVYDLETGNEVQRIDYDVWGVVTNDTNPGFQPFGFAGGLYDPLTDLVRFGARDYEAETARWLAKDPIQFKGGDTNLYGYVANDPVNFIDPTGLKSLCQAMKELLEHGSPFIDGSRFDRANLSSEYVPSGGHGPGGAHFTGPDGKDYDIQYIQVGYSIAGTYGAYGARSAFLGWMGVNAIMGDFDYFRPSHFMPNYRGLEAGIIGAKAFGSFKDFYSAICDDACE